MSPISKSLALALLVSLVVAAAAVARSSATAVSVTAGKPSEFRFTLSKKTVPKGTVTFRVSSAILTVKIPKAGKYKFLCTVPGHAAGGMKGVLTVK